jgi:hypothetical protein
MEELFSYHHRVFLEVVDVMHEQVLLQLLRRGVV